MSTFLDAYAECALWSSHDWAEGEDNPEMLDDSYGMADIAEETFAEIYS